MQATYLLGNGILIVAAIAWAIYALVYKPLQFSFSNYTRNPSGHKSQTTAIAADEINGAIAQLHDAAGELRQEMSRFKVAQD